MAHVTNFVPTLPIFRNLYKVMSCPIFRLRPLWPYSGRLSDPRWDIRGANAQCMKRLRDQNPREMQKKRRTEALEVPGDLQDMEIPLEDMGDGGTSSAVRAQCNYLGVWPY